MNAKEFVRAMGWDFSHIESTALSGISDYDLATLRGAGLSPAALFLWCLEQVGQPGRFCFVCDANLNLATGPGCPCPGPDVDDGSPCTLACRLCSVPGVRDGGCGHCLTHHLARYSQAEL